MEDFNKNLHPNTIMLGCFKSGTTYLHSILIANKAIFSPSVKEQNYFSDSVYGEAPLDLARVSREIARDFAGSAAYRYRIETSPCYLYMPEGKCLDLLRFYGNDAKFIVIIRRPSARLRSFFDFWNANGESFGTFPEFLDNCFLTEETGVVNRNAKLCRNAVRESQYSKYLEVWQHLDGFDWRERLLVVSFEDMIRRDDHFLQTLNRFFEFDEGLMWPGDGDAQRNQSVVNRSKALHRAYMLAAQFGNRYISKYPGLKYKLKRVYLRLNQKKLERDVERDLRLEALDSEEEVNLSRLGIEVSWTKS